MFLWIFKPIKEWSYCGGTCIVLADTFSKATELLGSYQEGTYAKGKPYLPVETDEFYEREYKVTDANDFEKWVLHEKFEVKDQEPRVVLVHFNWA